MLLGSWGAMQVCFEFSAFLFCHPGSSCTHLLVMQLPPGFLFGDSTSSACGLFVTSFSPLPYCATRCPYCSQTKNLQATAGVHVGSLSLSLSLSHTHTHTHTDHRLSKEKALSSWQHFPYFFWILTYWESSGTWKSCCAPHLSPHHSLTLSQF